MGGPHALRDTVSENRGLLLSCPLLSSPLLSPPFLSFFLSTLSLLLHFPSNDLRATLSTLVAIGFKNLPRRKTISLLSLRNRGFCGGDTSDSKSFFPDETNGRTLLFFNVNYFLEIKTDKKLRDRRSKMSTIDKRAAKIKISWIHSLLSEHDRIRRMLSNVLTYINSSRRMLQRDSKGLETSNVDRVPIKTE